MGNKEDMDNLNVADVCDIWTMLTKPIIVYLRDEIFPDRQQWKEVCNSYLLQVERYTDHQKRTSKQFHTTYHTKLSGIIVKFQTESCTTWYRYGIYSFESMAWWEDDQPDKTKEKLINTINNFNLSIVVKILSTLCNYMVDKLSQMQKLLNTKPSILQRIYFKRLIKGLSTLRKVALGPDNCVCRFCKVKVKSFDSIQFKIRILKKRIEERERA